MRLSQHPPRQLLTNLEHIIIIFFLLFKRFSKSRKTIKYMSMWQNNVSRRINNIAYKFDSDINVCIRTFISLKCCWTLGRMFLEKRIRWVTNRIFYAIFLKTNTGDDSCVCNETVRCSAWYRDFFIKHKVYCARTT